LNSVFLRTLLALPFLLAVFPAEVLLYSGEVTESSRVVVVDASFFRANIDLLSDLFICPLPELPWKIVTPSVKL
jgi:hypothetical protein